MTDPQSWQVHSLPTVPTTVQGHISTCSGPHREGHGRAVVLTEAAPPRGQLPTVLHSLVLSPHEQSLFSCWIKLQLERAPSLPAQFLSFYLPAWLQSLQEQLDIKKDQLHNLQGSEERENVGPLV